jgi:hypothetical protein
MSGHCHKNAAKRWLRGSAEHFVSSALMSDRFATLLIFVMIGSACFIIAAAPHLAAYTALVNWAAKLIS